MALQSVSVGNFKGIYDAQKIELKPITLFIGANSSGKSSVIHALAALAQTVNLPNNTRPLVLDDEFAYVHLGRFIEIIHSKDYADSIVLGVEGGHLRARLSVGSKPAKTLQGLPSVVYTFRSTRRTQEIFLESAEIGVGSRSYAITRNKRGVYTALASPSGRALGVSLSTGFSFEQSSPRFSLASYEELYPLFTTQRAIEQELRKTLYLGPFREPPQRRYPTRGSAPREVGPRGEATVTLLANEMVESPNRKHSKQISEWFETLGLAKNLGVSRVGGSDLFDVNITLRDGKNFPLADLGYGLSQILPVLTQLSFCPENATLLFEQPELHLHPLAAGYLAKVFIDAATKKRLHLVAETHSPELFVQFQQEMRAGSLPPGDFVAYHVIREGGCSKISPITIDENFDVYELWERGISKPE